MCLLSQFRVIFDITYQNMFLFLFLLVYSRQVFSLAYYSYNRIEDFLSSLDISFLLLLPHGAVSQTT